jgi:hypothetical protein
LWRVIPATSVLRSTEGFTWRFAPNTAFDLAGYYLAAGSALKMSELLNGVPVKRDQNDGYYVAARVRLSF